MTNYSIIPGGDPSILQNISKLKESMSELKPEVRDKTIALLTTIYTYKQITAMLDVSHNHIDYCCRKNRDIIEAATMGRNMSIADLAERKVIQLIADIDVGRISNERKSRAALDMMEVAEKAHNQLKPKDDKNENVFELIMRIKSRKTQPLPEESKPPIDITASVVNEEKK